MEDRMKQFTDRLAALRDAYHDGCISEDAMLMWTVIAAQDLAGDLIALRERNSVR